MGLILHIDHFSRGNGETRRESRRNGGVRERQEGQAYEDNHPGNVISKAQTRQHRGPKRSNGFYPPPRGWDKLRGEIVRKRSATRLQFVPHFFHVLPVSSSVYLPEEEKLGEMDRNHGNWQELMWVAQPNISIFATIYMPG